MIFYGVYIRDPDLAFLFDALRFIAQPDALRKAHITVRGPYERRINIDHFNKKSLGDLCIERPGNFFLNRQNTVFLYCEIVGIWDVWNKPDFQGGIVHLTVYDGNDEKTARQIFEALSRFDWKIWTKPTKLMELEKKVINNEVINILEPDFSKSLNRMMGEPIDLSSLRRAGLPERMKYINYLAKRINIGYAFRSSLR